MSGLKEKSPRRRIKALYAILQANPCLIGYAIVSLTLVLTFLFFTATPAGAGADGGKTIFMGRCLSCHTIERPAARPTIEEKLSEKGPTLWYAGSKYKDGFLAEWLQNPRPIRGMEYNSLTEKATGTHMALNSTEAAEVSAYLMGLTSPDVVEADIKPKSTVRGRFIFQKKFGCYGCHTIRRGTKIVGGLTGPTLTGTANRLNPDWVYSYLKNPRAFTPLSPMPNYSGLLSEVKLKALSAYVAAQK